MEQLGPIPDRRVARLS